jgi:hypothetical protein
MTEVVRIPKNFIPEKYDINLYVDIEDLEYEVNYDIYIRVDNLHKFLILNATRKNFQIKEITISKLDMISDHFVNHGKCDYFYNTDTDVNEFLSTSSDLDEDTIINFYTMMEKNKEAFYELKAGGSKLIEDSIYIILPNELEFSIKEVFKLTIKVQGKVNLANPVGFYFSVFGSHKLQLKENPNAFITEWKNDIDKYYNDGVFTCGCEPVEFRNVFPCFDEPCYKSKFNLKIILEKQFVGNFLKVLSNGDLIDVLEDEHIYTYIFTESPLMSIYLLTWTIGNFEYLETLAHNTRIRLYTPLGGHDLGAFGLDIAKKALDFYQDYFKIPYSFNKLDLVPVPDSDYRALECWGCVIFINYALLVDKFLNIKERKTISRTICHEISHMWFGNLVTMDWWDDIWLNEGFARYMEFVCLETIKPEFNIWDKYIELIYQVAIEIDEQASTHPVSGTCPSPKDLPDIFDTISYAKGSSVIRMLANYVGKDVFRNVIIKYLEVYQYSNTKTSDLWSMFKQVAGIDVESIMHNWVTKSGHPCLYVTLDCVAKKLKLKQSPFPKSLNNGDYIWKIPLFLKTNKRNFDILMTEQEIELDFEKDLQINEFDGQTFIKVNSDMQGFFRVNYSHDLLKFLLDNHQQLSKYDKIGLIGDYIAFKDYSICLEILKVIKPIDDYLTLSYAYKLYNIFKEYSFSHSCFRDIYTNHLTDLEDKVNQFFCSLIDKDIHNLKNRLFLTSGLDYLNEENDEFDDLALNFSCLVGNNNELINYIIEHFDYKAPTIHKNLKYTVVQIVLANYYTIKSDCEKELELYKNVLNEFTSDYFKLSLQERSYFKIALMNFQNTSDKLVEFFLDSFVNDNNIRSVYFRNFNLFRIQPNNRFRFIKAVVKKVREEFKEKGLPFTQYLYKSHWVFADMYILASNIYDSGLKEVVRNHLENEFKELCIDEGDVKYLDNFLRRAIIENSTNCLEDSLKSYNLIVEQLVDYFKT